MLLAQLLPELASNYMPPRLDPLHMACVVGKLTAVAALAGLNGDDFSVERSVRSRSCRLPKTYLGIIAPWMIVPKQHAEN